MTNANEDKELLTRVAAGDRDAMKAVYERHSSAVRNFVKSWLADPNEAADITHETMLSVWRDAGKFEGRSSAKAWIFSIARNKAIDRNRRAERISYTDETPDTPDEDPDPHAAVAAAEDAARLRECIEGLSAAHRRVVRLAFFEELSYSEIALAEGCPVGTVKTRMMHAKKLLMRCVAKKQEQRR